MVFRTKKRFNKSIENQLKNQKNIMILYLEALNE